MLFKAVLCLKHVPSHIKLKSEINKKIYASALYARNAQYYKNITGFARKRFHNSAQKKTTKYCFIARVDKYCIFKEMLQYEPEMIL